MGFSQLAQVSTEVGSALRNLRKSHRSSDQVCATCASLNGGRIRVAQLAQVSPGVGSGLRNLRKIHRGSDQICFKNTKAAYYYSKQIKRATIKERNVEYKTIPFNDTFAGSKIKINSLIIILI